MTMTKIITIATVSTVVLIAALMAGMPRYSVWQQEMSGRAELAKAEQNRQIKIQEAKALKESATFQAEAEVARAKGVAEANKIIGESLKNNEAYLRYLWVNALNDKEHMSTVYIPTEANMPLMKPVQ
jgi:regulator of protease activity HflC (stomatin/prohibitin superfamily)